MTIRMRQPWHERAACAGVDPEVFYPLDLAPGSAGVAVAKRVCAGCPVRRECLAEVLAVEDPARRWGISGGTTPAERAALVAARRAVGGSAGSTRLGVAA